MDGNKGCNGDTQWRRAGDKGAVAPQAKQCAVSAASYVCPLGPGQACAM